VLSMMCFSYSYLENEAWDLVDGQSRSNFRFTCGWGSSNTRRILSMVCQKAMRFLMRSEMLSGLMPFHLLWFTIQKNMYVTLWNTKIICTICVLGVSAKYSLFCVCVYVSWFLFINCCFENFSSFNNLMWNPT